jgi:hypothetical protein
MNIIGGDGDDERSGILAIKLGESYLIKDVLSFDIPCKIDQ